MTQLDTDFTDVFSDRLPKAVADPAPVGVDFADVFAAPAATTQPAPVVEQVDFTDVFSQPVGEPAPAPVAAPAPGPIATRILTPGSIDQNTEYIPAQEHGSNANFFNYRIARAKIMIGRPWEPADDLIFRTLDAELQEQLAERMIDQSRSRGHSEREIIGHGDVDQTSELAKAMERIRIDRGQSVRLKKLAQNAVDYQLKNGIKIKSAGDAALDADRKLDPSVVGPSVLPDVVIKNYYSKVAKGVAHLQPIHDLAQRMAEGGEHISTEDRKTIDNLSDKEYGILKAMLYRAERDLHPDFTGYWSALDTRIGRDLSSVVSSLIGTGSKAISFLAPIVAKAGGDVTGGLDAPIKDFISDVEKRRLRIRELSEVTAAADPAITGNGFLDASLTAADVAVPMVLAYGAGKLGSGISKVGGTVTAAAGPVVGATGSAIFYSMGVEEMHRDMIDAGIDDSIATPTALLAGIPYMMVEEAQLKNLLPRGAASATIRDIISGSLKKTMLQFGKGQVENLSVQVMEEMVQDGIRVVAKTLGAAIDPNTDIQDVIDYAHEADQILETGFESLKTFGFLQVPGGAIQLRRDLVNSQGVRLSERAAWLVEQMGFTPDVEVEAGAEAEAPVGDAVGIDEAFAELDAVLAEADLEGETTAEAPVSPEVGKAPIAPSEAVKAKPAPVVRKDEGVSPVVQAQWVVRPATGDIPVSIELVDANGKVLELGPDFPAIGSGRHELRLRAAIENATAEAEARNVALPPAAAEGEVGPEVVTKKLAPKLPSVPPKGRIQLSVATPVLHHEAGITSGIAMIPDSGLTIGSVRDIFVSNTPDLATGQGASKGIVFEFDSSKTDGVLSRRKPAWQISYASGAAEFETRGVSPEQLKDSVLSITIKPDLQGPKGRLRQLELALVRLEQQGWTKTRNTDGSETFRRPESVEVQRLDPAKPTVSKKEKVEPSTPPVAPSPAQRPGKVTIAKPVAGSPAKVNYEPLIEADKIVSDMGEAQGNTFLKKARSTFTRFTGLDTGIRKSLIEYTEQRADISKLAAKHTGKIFGKMSKAKVDQAQLAAEFPAEHDVDASQQKVIDQVKADQDAAFKEMARRGIWGDKPWPDGKIDWLSRRLGLALSKPRPKSGKSQRAYDQEVSDLEHEIESLEQLKQRGVQYVHRKTLPKDLIQRAKRRFLGRAKKITSKPTGLLGRVFGTIQEARAAGFKVVDFRESHAHYMETTWRSLASDDLIRAINENPHLAAPAESAPADWVELDPRMYQASKDLRYSPAISEAIEELAASRPTRSVFGRAYDGFNTAMKMIGFYNPIVMGKNDLVQMWRLSGMKSLVKIPRAFGIWNRKGKTYDRYRREGLFAHEMSFQPAADVIMQDMIRATEQSFGRFAAGEMAKWLNPIKITQNLREFNDRITWNLDEILRIAAAESIQTGRLAQNYGMSHFELTELANDFMANYGKVPKKTRRALNRVIFTPTYKISMARVLAQIYAQPNKFRAQLARHMAYKMFVWYVLPGLTAMLMLREWDDGRIEEGHKVVVKGGGKGGKDIVYSLSDPILEDAKVSQRPILKTLELNLAAAPNLALNLFRGPKYKNKRDQLGHLFKLGTPIWRDIQSWREEDKDAADKMLTQLAIAYSYERRPREVSRDTAIEAMLKAMSLWTDWKMQKEDLQFKFTGKRPKKPSLGRRTKRTRTRSR